MHPGARGILLPLDGGGREGVERCLPIKGALAKELAGDKANIYNATNALQDPHHVEARPSLIARARSADLVICTGADLEVGWLPLVLTQSGNAKIRAGQPGNFEASRFVSMLEVPADRKSTRLNSSHMSESRMPSSA